MSEPEVRVPCGVTRTTGRYVWVCVAPVHDTEKQRSSQLDSRGNPARSERHLFVRLHPWRDASHMSTDLSTPLSTC